MDQLCIDIPPGLWDRETAFWSALTGWDLQHQGESEFTRLSEPDGLPLRLLLQRLDDPTPTVTAHPDFAAPQRRSLAPAHAALGAEVGPWTQLWTVMTDPVGRTYCLTGRKI
nr:VOC family protein [Kineosporia babensis]